MPRDKKDEKEKYFLLLFFGRKSHIYSIGRKKIKYIERLSQDFRSTTKTQSWVEKVRELEGMKNGMKGCIET